MSGSGFTILCLPHYSAFKGGKWLQAQPRSLTDEYNQREDKENAGNTRYMQFCKQRERASISVSQALSSKANKGTRRMPWCRVPMKDVVHCEKLWRAVYRRNSQRCPNGETRRG